MLPPRPRSHRILAGSHHSRRPAGKQPKAACLLVLPFCRWYADLRFLAEPACKAHPAASAAPQRYWSGAPEAYSFIVARQLEAAFWATREGAQRQQELGQALEGGGGSRLCLSLRRCALRWMLDALIHRLHAAASSPCFEASCGQWFDTNLPTLPNCRYGRSAAGIAGAVLSRGCRMQGRNPRYVVMRL